NRVIFPAKLNLGPPSKITLIVAPEKTNLMCVQTKKRSRRKSSGAFTSGKIRLASAGNTPDAIWSFGKGNAAWKKGRGKWPGDRHTQRWVQNHLANRQSAPPFCAARLPIGLATRRGRCRDSLALVFT